MLLDKTEIKDVLDFLFINNNINLIKYKKKYNISYKKTHISYIMYLQL